MKKAFLLVAGVLLTLGSGLNAQAQTAATKADTLYRQGLLAMKHGDADTARACFTEVVRLQPTNMHAKYQLKNLELRKDSMLGKKKEMELKKVTIPKVDFDNLTLPEALEALGALVEQKTEGKLIPNFIIQDPKGVFEERKFSLKLGGVPASIVLKYAIDSAKATVRYDAHAIVVQPIGGGKAPPAAPAKRGGGKDDDPFAR